MGKLLLSICFITITILMYMLGKWIYSRTPFPLLLPIVTATVMIICLLLIFQVDYDTYMVGGKWIHAFLGPAVVALAYPLYIHREVLARYSLPIGLGSIVGACIGIVSGIGLTKLFQFEEVLIMSIAPKSVTTAVAMEVSRAIGGIPAIAAVFVTIAGISGVILAGSLFRLFHIQTTIGRGVGLGSAAHAIGTSKLMEESFFEGSVATVGMIMNAVVVSIILPYMLLFL